MFILTQTELIILVIFHFVLVLAAFAYEMYKTKGRFTFSTIVWGLVLFSLPVLGIAVYGLVQLVLWLFANEDAEVSCIN